MHNIVIDTNVLVSSLIQTSYPHKIIYELFLEDKIQLCLSQELLNEYYEVLHRPKFARYYDFLTKAESVLVDIVIKSKFFSPHIHLELISDKNDNILLELADVCCADFIITGNTTDFVFPLYKTTQIVTPKEYWESYRDE
jgi:putative PIN family toxin of toxin-antitoxin system